jgi:drug/metabolite transporter (DMT)-like permease
MIPASQGNHRMTTLYLPILAAILYGLNYAILGEVLKHYTMGTYVFFSMGIWILLGGIHCWWYRDTIDFSVAKTDYRLFVLMAIAVITSFAAWLMTSTVMQQVNPTFAAIGEVSYPIFVPLFAYLLFKDNQLDRATVLGGLMVFSGLFVLIYARQQS